MNLDHLKNKGIVNARLIATANASEALLNELSLEGKKKSLEAIKKLTDKANSETQKNTNVIKRTFKDFFNAFKRDESILKKMLVDLKNEDITMKFGFTRDKNLCESFSIAGKAVDIVEEYKSLIDYGNLITSYEIHKSIADAVKKEQSDNRNDPLALIEALFLKTLEAYGMDDSYKYREIDIHHTRPFIGDASFCIYSEPLELEGREYTIVHGINDVKDLTAKPVDAIPLMTKVELISLLESVLAIYSSVTTNSSVLSHDAMHLIPILGASAEGLQRIGAEGVVSDDMGGWAMYGAQMLSDISWLSLIVWKTIGKTNSSIIKLVQAHYDYENF